MKSFKYVAIIIVVLITFWDYSQSQQHHHEHSNRVEPFILTHGKPPRSIVDSHPNGSARSCEFEKDLIDWLPKNYELKDTEGHYHLLLAASDHQLPILINWLAVSFALGYLPSPRLQLHFHCDGPSTKRFVENHLFQECMEPPKRKLKKKGESQWRRIVQDRLGSTLELVKSLDDSDYGALTFDLDAPWIRNMITVFDYFGHGHGQNDDSQATSTTHTNSITSGYDFISMGTIMEGRYDGRVISNFGAVFFKNSVAGKALAERAWWSLNSDWEANYPDQDYVTAALFDGTNITQRPIPPLSHLTNTTLYKTDASLCAKYPKTCDWVAVGTEGEFTLSQSGSGNKKGKYMFLPQIVAPRDCRRICSGSTVILQHCGIAYCMTDLLQITTRTKKIENLHCSEIPEYILKSIDILGEVNKDTIPIASKNVPVSKSTKSTSPSKGSRGGSGVFDSRAQAYMIDVIEHFVDKDRLQSFCRAYPSVCTPIPSGSRLSVSRFNITVHTKVLSDGGGHRGMRGRDEEGGGSRRKSYSKRMRHRIY